MITVDLNKNDNKPLYVKVYESIKSDIESGRIAPLEKLPSKRALAEHLGVSVITIQNAYAQLIAEGYIRAEERRGFFAADLSQFIKDRAGSQHIEKRLSESEEEKDEELLIDVSSVYGDIRQFPFSVWTNKMRYVISENYDKILNMVPNKGLWELRVAISNHLYKFRGIEVDPNLIYIGSGADYNYGMIVKLLGRDKVYAVEDPGYDNIRLTYKIEGVDTRFIALDEHGIRVDRLKSSAADIVHISPTHQYPTGISMPVKRRKEILEWAYEKEGRYIIEDDYDSEYRFEGRPLPTMQSIDPGGKVIYMNSFSKTIAPSLRICYLILPEKLAKEYDEMLGYFPCPVCSFEQYVLAEFIKDGHFERHINRMRRYYKQNKDEIYSLIRNSPLGKKSEIREELAGLHFTLKLKTDKSDMELKEEARKRGLGISFISEFASEVNEEVNSLLMINYSVADIGEMKTVVDILSEIV
ncbi:MAG: PLP-dependent aminotransferase family protein [Firmicutes bacterium]|nr:PLP-dependent aminotransferase family protein [Bacillota bacterium]